MRGFKREERYIVVKLSDLTKEHQKDLRRYLAVKDMRTREGVVVEADWTIYDETWENVQRLAEGRPSIKDEFKAIAEVNNEAYWEMHRDRDALAALCAEAAGVLERTANDTLLGRHMADKLRRQSEGTQ